MDPGSATGGTEEPAIGKVATALDWSDFVAAPEVIARLDEMVAGRRGSAEPGGQVALFRGPSGTGKTLAAALIARSLGVELFRIDLESVAGKYIGETEKNLSRLFEEAEASGAVLMFDEADALFGKRSEVKDSHDRYANLELGSLLQRIEDFRGLVILATNRKSNIDPAFLRRLRFVIDFTLPDPAMRLKLWRQAVGTAGFKIADEELSKLAKAHELTGGGIADALRRAAAGKGGSTAVDGIRDSLAPPKRSPTQRN